MSAKLGNGSVIFGDGSSMSSAALPYSSISGTPTIPSNNNQLTNGAGYITTSRTLLGTFTVHFTGYGQNTGPGLTGVSMPSSWSDGTPTRTVLFSFKNLGTGSGFHAYGGGDYTQLCWGPTMLGDQYAAIVTWYGTEELYVPYITWGGTPNGISTTTDMYYTCYVYYIS